MALIVTFSDSDGPSAEPLLESRDPAVVAAAMRSVNTTVARKAAAAIVREAADANRR